MKVFWLIAIVLIVSAGSVRIYRDKRSRERPNILIFIADDFSRIDMNCYGNQTVRSPNIDEFAREIIHFNRMFTPTAMCSPSHSALYSGLYPHRNGCHMNYGNVLEGIKRNLKQELHQWMEVEESLVNQHIAFR